MGILHAQVHHCAPSIHSEKIVISGSTRETFPLCYHRQLCSSLQSLFLLFIHSVIPYSLAALRERERERHIGFLQQKYLLHRLSHPYAMTIKVIGWGIKPKQVR